MARVFPAASGRRVGSDELEGSLKRAEKLGGKRVMDPITLPDGVAIALFADPEGHVVGLVNEPAKS